MMNKIKYRISIVDRQYLLYTLTFITGICLWYSVTYYALYQKIDEPAFQEYIDRYLSLSNSDLIFSDDFIASYIGIHDPDFFKHRGINFSRDLKSSFRHLRAGEMDEENLNLTRQVASQIVTEGKFGGFYRSYMFPVLIEKEIDKQHILKISKQLRQNEAGVSYDQVKIWLELENTLDYSKYHWILLHSMFESVLKNKTDVYNAETLFFDHLTKLYASGYVQDSDIEEIYLRYRTDFLNDATIFFMNYRRSTLNLFDQNRSGVRLGGAIFYAELAGYYAQKYNISFPLFMAIIQSESNGDPGAISRAGALGLAQIMPATARDVTNNHALKEEQLFIPHVNLDISAQYIRTIKGWVDRYYPNLDPKNRIDFIASAYNAGWSRVRRVNGVPNILETRNYVQRVHHYHDVYEHFLLATEQI